MFTIAVISGDVRIAPHNLHLDAVEAVTDEIQKAYCDKVVDNVGLAVTVYEIDSIEGGHVYPSEGAAHFLVTFRLVMFCPFLGEVLLGKLSKCDETGIYVSLGFFEDVHIPEHMLQVPSHYDEKEKVWVWKFDDNDMYMDLDEEIRFKVHSVRFPPRPPGDPPMISTASGKSGIFAPMQVEGNINGDGLGLVSWWS
eukprot:jgi/Mesvir1/24710/Mv21988-RA.1